MTGVPLLGFHPMGNGVVMVSRADILKLCTTLDTPDDNTNLGDIQAKDIRKLKWDYEKAYAAFEKLNAFEGNTNFRTVNCSYYEIISDKRDENDRLDKALSEIARIINGTNVQYTQHAPNIFPYEIWRIDFVNNMEGGTAGDLEAFKMLPIYLMTGIDPSKDGFFIKECRFLDHLTPKVLEFKQANLCSCDFSAKNVSNRQGFNVEIKGKNFQVNKPRYTLIHNKDTIAEGRIGFTNATLHIDASRNDDAAANVQLSEPNALDNLNNANIVILITPDPDTKSYKIETDSTDSQGLQHALHFSDLNGNRLWARVMSDHDGADPAQLTVNCAVSTAVGDMKIDSYGGGDAENGPDTDLRTLAVDMFRDHQIQNQLGIQNQDMLCLGSWEDILMSEATSKASGGGDDEA